MSEQNSGMPTGGDDVVAEIIQKLWSKMPTEENAIISVDTNDRPVQTFTTSFSNQPAPPPVEEMLMPSENAGDPTEFLPPSDIPAVDPSALASVVSKAEDDETPANGNDYYEGDDYLPPAAVPDPTTIYNARQAAAVAREKRYADTIKSTPTQTRPSNQSPRTASQPTVLSPTIDQEAMRSRHIGRKIGLAIGSIALLGGIGFGGALVVISHRNSDPQAEGAKLPPNTTPKKRHASPSTTVKPHGKQPEAATTTTLPLPADESQIVVKPGQTVSGIAALIIKATGQTPAAFKTIEAEIENPQINPNAFTNGEHELKQGVTLTVPLPKVDDSAYRKARRQAERPSTKTTTQATPSTTVPTSTTTTPPTTTSPSTTSPSPTTTVPKTSETTVPKSVTQPKPTASLPEFKAVNGQDARNTAKTIEAARGEKNTPSRFQAYKQELETYLTGKGIFQNPKDHNYSFIPGREYALPLDLLPKRDDNKFKRDIESIKAEVSPPIAVLKTQK